MVMRNACLDKDADTVLGNYLYNNSNQIVRARGSELTDRRPWGTRGKTDVLAD